MLQLPIYALTIASRFALLVITKAAKVVVWCVRKRLGYFLMKHFVYPIFIRRTRLNAPIHRNYVILLLLYWGGTAVCKFIGSPAVPVMASRAGTIAIVNMIPLFFSSRLAFIADLLGISLRAYQWVHRAMGVMVFAQGLLHTLLITRRLKLDTTNQVQHPGILVSYPSEPGTFTDDLNKGAASIVLILLLFILRSSYYDFTSKSHFILAGVAAAALWKHAGTKSIYTKLYFVVGAAIFALTALLQYARTIWHNFGAGKRGTTIEIKRIEDALIVHTTLPRGLTVRAGQYVYLWVPGASPFAFLQSHPFVIAQWSGQGSKSESITMLLKIRNGFTKHLADSAPRSNMRAVVDGPYGEASCYGEFGTVLLLATGIGIASQISHVKEILQGHSDRAVNTRRIMMVWQVDREAQENWVSNWMQELLEMDKKLGSNMLRVRLYVSGEFKEENCEYGVTKEYSEHDRLQKLYREVDLDGLFEQEVRKCLGRILI